MIECVPLGSDEVVQVAVPLLMMPAGWQLVSLMVTPSDLKVAWPVAGPSLPPIVAVKVTALPTTEGFAEEAMANVGVSRTVTFRLADAAPYVASPE